MLRPIPSVILLIRNSETFTVVNAKVTVFGT